MCIIPQTKLIFLFSQNSIPRCGWSSLSQILTRFEECSCTYGETSFSVTVLFLEIHIRHLCLSVTGKMWVRLSRMEIATLIASILRYSQQRREKHFNSLILVMDLVGKPSGWLLHVLVQNANECVGVRLVYLLNTSWNTASRRKTVEVIQINE